MRFEHEYQKKRARKTNNISIYFDDDTLDRLEQLDNKSAFVQAATREALEKVEDPFEKVSFFNKKIAELSEQRDDLLNEVTRISIEGAIKEREEAEALLKEQERKAQEKISKLKEKLSILCELPSWNDFVQAVPQINFSDSNALVPWVTKFWQEGAYMKVGNSDLRAMSESGLFDSFHQVTKNEGGVY